ncbi:SGNH/GDSL hydrolase family protein [Mucilaginibacter sp. UR6-1]|uniref:SGNH/GDSL hydrolase family protein n=1 Tax=Mucilaginibacter sp. UR6-1 TaxID=1435643 RepID=UPI001E5B35AE|nr:SGNH/GDSL hydrolase family protein [Mucilaginibacter sp. UR6-1]MCC8410231.1 SGNH/GDSL hydrolase family protein [Mucilaginibacter sp. UR6-1]
MTIDRQRLLLCRRFIFIVLTAVLYSLHTSAQTTWKGFAQTHVNIAGHKAYYVKPRVALPGRPWVWRASFADWHTGIDSLLLSRGFHVAYVSVDDEYGSPYAMQVWDSFYNYLTDSVKLAPRVALEAVSRGGLYALGWAKRNPDKVSCIYAETPVYDIKSWPGGKGKGLGDETAWNHLKQVYKFTEAQALAYNDNPLNNLEGLASYKVPVLNMVGLEDKVVPPAENSLLFAQRYIAAGGPVTTYPVTEGPQQLNGHHVPDRHNDEWADFIYCNSYPVKKILPYADYYKKRNGINNFYHAATINKKATVAFLGGSITFNPGWRDRVYQYLKERFPQTKFRFIMAGIPSLGSLPHAFRLQRDLLDSGKVDLLFVEAAVNDRVNKTDSLTQVRALEGIIRHARKTNPQMDIVMMEFADPDKTNDYNAGKQPVEITNHELVAEHYGLPSINIAKGVKEKLANNEFNWNDDFKDLHPAIFGQELYFAFIKSLLTDCFDHPSAKAKKYHSPKPLNQYSFEHGQYYSITNARHDDEWKINQNWQPADGLGTRPGFVHVPVLVATTPGATLSLPFKGSAIGIAIVSGGDAGIITYSIDGAPFKQADLYTEWSGFLHLPWYIMLGRGLKNGDHTLQIKISADKSDKSKGNACRIVNFLINK